MTRLSFFFAAVFAFAAAPASAGIVDMAQIAATQSGETQQSLNNEINVGQISSYDRSIVEEWSTGTAGNPMSAAETSLGANTSLIFQQDTAGAIALVEQFGAGNTSSIIQQNSAFPGGLYAEVHQTTSGNQSEIAQSGALNSAFVYQSVTSGSFSSIVQSGSGNLAIVHQ